MMAARDGAEVHRHSDRHGDTGAPIARLAPLPGGDSLPVTTADLAIVGGGLRRHHRRTCRPRAAV